MSAAAYGSFKNDTPGVHAEYYCTINAQLQPTKILVQAVLLRRPHPAGARRKERTPPESEYFLRPWVTRSCRHEGERRCQRAVSAVSADYTMRRS